ncbi:MAG: hypothetical protein ACI90V_004957 [Bacillariaceae sp.]|jgi:hypothetical protein
MITTEVSTSGMYHPTVSRNERCYKDWMKAIAENKV